MKTYSQWRWIFKVLQAILILGIPFITINGNSLLRFDIPTLKLYFFGKAYWMEDFFIVLPVLLFFAFLFILITLLYGRIWCGWVCPQTVLNDIVDLIFGKKRKKSLFRKLFSHIATLAFSIVVGANLIWYFVTPYEFFERLFKGNLGGVTTGFWVVLSAITFLNLLLVKRRFCATVCPYAKLQSVMFDKYTMVIAFDQNRKHECLNCKACVRVCPVSIDIREGLDSACINCAECIDICKEMVSRRNLKTLIDYRFGISDEAMKLFRPQAIVFTLLTLLSLFALIYVATTQKPFDIVITQNHAFVPRLLENGSFVNSYILTISNKTDREISLNLTAKGSSTRKLLESSPRRLLIPANARERIPVYVMLSSDLTESNIDISLTSTEGTVYQKSVGFIKPAGVN
jgi:cytochrome c oxidase accessory protein FixG